VQIYGTIDEFAGQLRTKTATTNDKVTAINNGGLTTSFIGFKGTEDLGDGLKALFALETFVRADTGQIGRNDTDPFFARLAVTGLEGSWGRVTAGRHVTPYSLATTLNTPFVGSTTLSPIFAHVYNLNLQGGTRFDNGVQYSSPDWAGFSFDALYSLGQERNSAAADRKRDRAQEIVARYTSGPLRLTGGYHFINLNNNNDDHEQDARMIAAVYDFGAAKVNGQHHRVRESFRNAASDAHRRTTEVGLTVPVGVGNILATYARSHMSDNSAATPDQRKSFAIGYDHYLSKRTDVYTAYYKDKLLNPLTEQRILAVGLRHRF
jgi:predicted porin